MVNINVKNRSTEETSAESEKYVSTDINFMVCNDLKVYKEKNKRTKINIY